MNFRCIPHQVAPSIRRQILRAHDLVDQELQAAIARVHVRVPMCSGPRHCAMCGNAIPAKRLALLPSATRCLTCQTHREHTSSANQ